MRISQATFDWLCRETAVKPESRTRTVLCALFVNGETYAQAADEAAVQEFTARKIASRWKQKVAMHRDEVDKRTREELQKALDDEQKKLLKARLAQVEFAVTHMEEHEEGVGDGDTLTAFQQATAILSAISGHVASNPPTPTFDELGRKVGGGSEMVDVGKLAGYIAELDAARACPPVFEVVHHPRNWKLGPYRGALEKTFP